MKFYICSRCGQIVGIVRKTSVPMICCGEDMMEIIPHSTEDSVGEKHIPVYKIKNGRVTVNVGSVPHPMTSDHYIEWVAIVTSKGNQRKCLKPGDAPEVTFLLEKDEILKEIYAYCNIHSLWINKVHK